MVLSTIFGTIGALLASIGLYGALDYAVKSRTREIGVRTALGAEPARIHRLFSREVFLLTAGGVVLDCAVMRRRLCICAGFFMSFARGNQLWSLPLCCWWASSLRSRLLRRPTAPDGSIRHRHCGANRVNRLDAPGRLGLGIVGASQQRHLDAKSGDVRPSVRPLCRQCPPSAAGLPEFGAVASAHESEFAERRIASCSNISLGTMSQFDGHHGCARAPSRSPNRTEDYLLSPMR